MKTLTIIAMILMAGIITGTAFADSKLDSLVSLATQAKIQIKLQMDRTNPSEEIRGLYQQGSKETDLLAAAARQGNAEEAKQHFLAAMKIFRQITQSFSEQTAVSQAPPQAPPVPEFDYKNAISRLENAVSKLKSSAAKNNLPVDFSKIDGLIEQAKTSIANDDTQTLAKSYGELKVAIAEMQKTIKNMTAQLSNERARVFVTNYINKIDLMLAQAKELNLSDQDIAKLNKIKEELAMANDTNQIIIKIKRYTISINNPTSTTTVAPGAQDQLKQRIMASVSELDSKLADMEPQIDDSIRPKFEAAKELVGQLQNQQTDDAEKALKILEANVLEIQDYLNSKSSLAPEKSEPKEKPSKQPQTDSQDSEIEQLEARLEQLRPQVDDSIKSKFEKAQALLIKLKNQDYSSNSEYNKIVKSLDSLLNQLERSIKDTQSGAAPDSDKKHKKEADKKRPQKND